VQEFQTPIKDGCSLGLFVAVPFDVEKEFGKKWVKIIGTADGVQFKGVICNVIPLGNIIALKKNLLREVGKQVGENVSVRLEKRQR